jgi:hypothetical protein
VINYDSRGNYPVTHQARWLGLGNWCGLRSDRAEKHGFRVHVLDHCDKNALIEKYRRHGISVENIEEVDFVWDGRPYVELVGSAMWRARHVSRCSRMVFHPDFLPADDA